MSVHASEIQQNDREQFRTRHSIITIERGPAGTLARIERDGGGEDYAGPLDDETVAALREVTRRV